MSRKKGLGKHNRILKFKLSLDIKTSTIIMNKQKYKKYSAIVLLLE